MEKGKLTVKNSGSATIKNSKGKELNVPRQYHFSDRSLHGSECEFELVNGVIVKIVVKGIELVPDDTVLKPKEEAKAKREAEIALQKEKEKQQRANENKDTGSSHVVNDILNFNQTRLPKDTRAIVIEDIDNFAIKLNKAAFFNQEKPDSKDWKFQFCRTTRKGYESKIKANYGELSTRFVEIANRQMKYAKVVCDGKIEQLEMRPDWRLIVGLGNESVYETSITLHHVYGFPYIPASSIKGVVRSWIITNIFDGSEGKAIEDKGFCTMFGCPENLTEERGEGREKTKKEYTSAMGFAYAGTLVFFDAYPLTPPYVEPDIMNPHYSKYYGESADNARNAPVDYENPIPVNFLTVIDTTFQFIVGVRHGKENIGISIKNSTKSDLLSLAKNWLKKSLSEHGIGAKTAVGYGYMQ